MSIRIYSTDEVEQGSDLWLKLRSQYITGTDAYAVLRGTPIDKILFEKQHKKAWGGNYYTKRGHLLEEEAKTIYSEVYEPTQDAGFITNDKYPLAGYSPDALIGEEGLGECKAFNEKRHLEVYESLDPHIVAQVQFGLFVSERKWCDLILYNPEIEDVDKTFLVKRIYPIEDIQKKLQLFFAIPLANK